MQLASAAGSNPAPFATGVAAIRFAISFVNNPDAWREIDVQGSATVPEPSGIVLVAGLGLGGMGLGYLWRRHRC
jgi:hypothetical protein